MGILLVWAFCAFIAAAIAGNKGRSRPGWFLLGLLFGPFSWVVALLPPAEGNLNGRK